jgi:hypothetical protein
MTDAKWLKSKDPRQMLAFVAGKAHERKLWLFVLACCWRVSYVLHATHDGDALDAMEHLVDTPFTSEQVGEMVRRMHLHLPLTAGHHLDRRDWVGFLDVLTTAIKMTPNRLESWYWPITTRAHVGLLRDIFGNPFRAPTIEPSCLAWNNGTVRNLAQAIYADRAFDRLPILADALEDACCTATDILAHCRGGGEHVKGCWVVDLLLGKS